MVLPNGLYCNDLNIQEGINICVLIYARIHLLCTLFHCLSVSRSVCRRITLQATAIQGVSFSRFVNLICRRFIGILRQGTYPP
jgi:hypothetical protein